MRWAGGTQTNKSGRQAGKMKAQQTSAHCLGCRLGVYEQSSCFEVMMNCKLALSTLKADMQQQQLTKEAYSPLAAAPKAAELCPEPAGVQPRLKHRVRQRAADTVCAGTSLQGKHTAHKMATQQHGKHTESSV